MAVPRTLSFTPSPNVVREAITRTTVVGQPGFFHAYNYSSRPYYKFSLELGPLVRREAEELSALHAYHQGARTFHYDGGQYGLVDDLFVAQADGVRKEYFLPNRNIDIASYTIKTRRYSGLSFTDSTWVHAIASLRFATGIVVLGTAPFSGDQVRASYCCKYRVSFAPEGLQLDQFGPGLYNAQIELIENPGIVLDPFGVPSFYQITLAAGLRTVARVTEHVPIQRMKLQAEMVATTVISARTTVSSTGFHQQALAAKAIMTTSVGRATTTQTASGRFGSNVIADSATSTNVNMTTTSQFVIGVPYWNTDWWISSRSAALNVVTFGTAPGSGGSRFDWSVVGS